MLFIVTKCEVTVDGYHVIDTFVGSCWIDDLDYLTKLFYSYFDNAQEFQQHFKDSPLHSLVSPNEIGYYVYELFKFDFKETLTKDWSWFSLVGFSSEEKDSFINTFIERCD